MQFDLVIRNASILDGRGGDAVEGDVGIAAGRIAAMGSISGAGTNEIDAAGATLTPGFIDVHTHDDRLVLADLAVVPKISQGITTLVTGNCGISLAPMTRAGSPVPPLTLLGREAAAFHANFASYIAALRRTPSSINVVPLVGHSALRACVMDDLDRDSTEAERDRMGALLEEAMAAGAFGLSTGLWYPPAEHASPGEVESLLRRVADHGGLQTAHIRSEDDGLMDALDEALLSARRAGTPLVISHLKCAGEGVWGKAGAVLEKIDDATTHQEVAFDVYPYDASSTVLDPDRLEGARRIVVSWSEPHPEEAGKDLDVIAERWCCSPRDAAKRLGPAGGIFHKMQEHDVRRILAHPRAMIGSDGLPHDVHPHPRLWGTFPRVLGRYVRDLGALTLPEAVRRMTSLPAAVFGLKDRGIIAEGMAADLTLLDASMVADQATYDHPTQPPSGIIAVIVNGEAVAKDGATGLAYPGRVLTAGLRKVGLRG